MRAADLNGKKTVIWGAGREGTAVARLIAKTLPGQKPVFVDEGEGPQTVEGFEVIREPAGVAAALDHADILVKSPGVSLYHPLIQRFKKRGAILTSLLDLWLAEPHDYKTVCVTGTKGKSTTSALLAHALNGIGKKAVLAGNIGLALSEADWNGAQIGVIEVSSYQAAALTQACDIAVLTSLAPEHLDWHRSIEKYYADKLNLLAHAQIRIADEAVLGVLSNYGLAAGKILAFNRDEAIHARDGKLFDGIRLLGALKNNHLARPHNLSNVCAALTAIKALGLDASAALKAMESYQPLPHRQEELGEKDGVLYVNDSIATTPQAAIAALDYYHTRPITLIAGGYDRGIDYEPLISYILKHRPPAVIFMGPSGQRMLEALKLRRTEGLFTAASMQEAVETARKKTPKGGVVLLSPAAPSYGLFKDFTERGRAFAAACGFAPRDVENNR